MESFLSTAQRQTAFPVEQSSHVSMARRAGNELAQVLGFDETVTGRVALVITEAATNILKHANRGQVLLRAVSDQGAFGVEIIAIDSGPGMANLNLNMEDGHSTAGSYGVGLGAMRRQSCEFDAYTGQDGTAIRMLIWSHPEHKPLRQSVVGVVCLPLEGEEECGDAWTVTEADSCLTVLVADGLGHGADAARASRAAAMVAEQKRDAVPAALMEHVHAALHDTRGAAVAIAQVDLHTRHVHFAGVGNIAGAIHHGDVRQHLISHNGIVGSNLRKLQQFSYPLENDSLLIMHTDGIGTRWDLKHYPGLIFCHPGIIAAVIYRDFARARDDAAIVVVRELIST